MTLKTNDILVDHKEILSAFVLCNTNSGEKSVEWEKIDGKSLYLERFAVHVKHSKKGIGSLMLAKAKQVAKESGAEYLRLFVVDCNKPAIQFYEKNNFTRATGIYHDVFDGLELYQFGYETKL